MSCIDPWPTPRSADLLLWPASLQVSSTAKEIKMARKLCWDEHRYSGQSRSLSSWGAFQSDRIETITGLGDHYTDKAAFVMTNDGMSFELTYRCGRANSLHRAYRMKLSLSPRRRGFERLVICPRCERRIRCQALIGRGVDCAVCFDIRCPLKRESRIARLVRRAGETTGALAWRNGGRYRGRRPRECVQTVTRLHRPLPPAPTATVVADMRLIYHGAQRRPQTAQPKRK
jgi:hypothetical protein